MKVFPKNPEVALAIKCPACGALPGIYCGTQLSYPAVHERRDLTVLPEEKA